jgi:hypothetical protein
VFEGGSVYRKAFRQGATLVPRFLCFVERRTVGRLGADVGSPHVVSRRSTQEKRPWKDLPGIEGRVEAEFLRPVLLGESILPFRVWRPLEGVIPVTDEGVVLDAEAATNRGYSGLSDWMRQAERVWNENAGEGNQFTLIHRWNFHNELGAQFPLGQRRVLFAASGTIPAACVAENGRILSEHALYWAAVLNKEEGYYLAAILNAETTRARAASFQARGQWGARHFDKVMFNLPIPRFDPTTGLHGELTAAAAEAEELAAAVDIPERAGFVRARGLVRDALKDAGIAQRIDALVERLLDG